MGGRVFGVCIPPLLWQPRAPAPPHPWAARSLGVVFRAPRLLRQPLSIAFGHVPADAMPW